MMGLSIGFGLFGLVLMVLFWGGLIALALWLVRSLFPPAKKLKEQPDFRDLRAGEILKQRYVRGEISQIEYDVMKEMLSREGAAKNTGNRRTGNR